MPCQSARVPVGVAFTLVAALPALAGSFQVQQQGAKAAGRGNAFVAQADDASATWYNPAAAAQMDGWNVYVGGSLLAPGATFTATADGMDVDMESVTDLPAQIYVVGRITDAYSVALGLNESHALRTGWPAGNPITLSSLDTEWTSHDYHFDWVVKVGGKWGFALGIDWINFRFEEFSSAYDFTRLVPFLFPPPEPLRADRNYVLSGDKPGYNFALHYKADNGYRFGMTYRSQRVVRMDGKEQWMNVSEATFLPGTPLVDDSGCAFNPMFCPMGAAFTDSTASATVVIPATLLAGIAREGIGKWDWEVDLLYTRWSAFSALSISVDSPNGVRQGFAFVPTTVDLAWVETRRDTLSLFAGADYHAADAHAIRFGLSLDPTPLPQSYTRPYDPDTDRLGLTAGYGFRSGGGKILVDVYGQYWIYDAVTTPQDPPQAVVGGTYDPVAYAAGASFQYRF
jgi:long-chain fatty acid transport protein